MHSLKTQGFSLIEVLIGLVLASLVLTLMIENLSRFALASTRMIQSIQNQDYAITALILLQHQIEAASLTECTPETQRPYHILSPTQLELHTLSDTFYVRQYTGTSTLIAPSGYAGKRGEAVIIDDCQHVLHSRINSKVGKNLEIAHFNPAEFQLPFSVSLVDTRLYSFKNGILYLKKNGGDNNKLIPHLQSLTFSPEAVVIDGKYQFRF